MTEPERAARYAGKKRPLRRRTRAHLLVDGEVYPSRREAMGAAAGQINEQALGQARPNTRWAILLVRSGNEFVAQRSALKAGFETFLPVYRRYRRLTRYDAEKRRLVYPALPGALFLPTAPGVFRWLALLREPFVSGAVGVGGAPATIEHQRFVAFLDGNQSFFDVPESFRHMPTHGEFVEGDRVEVLDGVFSECVVDVKAIRGRLAEIAVPMLGGERVVRLPLDNLRKKG